METETKESQKFWGNLKSQIYIISAVFTIVIIFLILFFAFPYFKEIKQNSEELVSVKNNLASLGDQVSEVEKFEINYVSYRADLEKIDRLYVDSKNPAEFFEFLEKTADECQVAMEVSLAENSSSKASSFVGFKIFSTGEFSKVLKFLEKLEAGQYLVEVQELSISSSEQSGAAKKTSTKQVDANFLIRAFTKPL